MTNVDAPTTGLGELSGLLASWRLHLEAANLSPRTIRAYADDGMAFLADKGTPTAVRGVVAEFDRTAPASAAARYRSV